ncbi:MAG: imidazolonepropionase [Muribaculaceae bacterium]|nr:imidazolonepropionase [Muribaculaceae bacterium]
MLITNIGLLAGIDPGHRICLRGEQMRSLGMLENAWLHIRDGRFASWGYMDMIPEPLRSLPTVDAARGAIIPAFCDSHTHIVYAGSREREFIDKIRGLSYEEIARRGGGILNSADRLAHTSEEELFDQAMARAREVMSGGTGAIEIKSGYGLTVKDELKILRVIARVAQSSPMKVKATFLGAHAVGRAYAGRQDEYVELVCHDMLPAVAAEGLAEYVDVFCDRGFFTTEQTDRILTAASKYGLKPKIHANELDNSGGVQVGLKHHALSVDHLEQAGDEEIRLLAQSDTAATMLPGASFFLGMPYAPARKAVDAGAIVALASDYNPGSSPSGSMRFVMSLGCIKMKLTPNESLAATTLNGAYAMGLSEEYGSITEGKVANFIITSPLPSFGYLAYAYTSPLIRSVYLRGVKVSGSM